MLLGFVALTGLTASAFSRTTLPALQRYFDFSDSSEFWISILYMAINFGCSFGGLLLLFFWDRRVATGLILYEEISDEVEWQHRSYRREKKAVNGSMSGPIDKPPFPSKSTRPNLDVRVILRAFLKESTLPFLRRGSGGTSVYALFFIACIAGAITILTIQSR